MTETFWMGHLFRTTLVKNPDPWAPAWQLFIDGPIKCVYCGLLMPPSHGEPPRCEGPAKKEAPPPEAPPAEGTT